jgi:broad specificity phosphatase PhoE
MPLWHNRRTAPDPRVPNDPARLFIVARHAESVANLAGVISSDPALPLGLTARGVDQAHELGAQLANLQIGLAVCSSFARTRQTLELALGNRQVPVLVEADFDEVRAGDLDKAPIGQYSSWRARHHTNERFPHGESVDEAILRYAKALRRVLSRSETVTLLIVHEFALWHVLAASTGVSVLCSSEDVIVNARPYLFDELAITNAVVRLEGSGLGPDSA